MLDIHPIHLDEFESAKTLLPSDAAEPDWGHCYVVLDNKEIVGIIGTEVRLRGLLAELVVEPFYMARAGSIALVGMGFIDGLMRCIAAANGFTGYGFSVRNSNQRFQGFCERFLPVKVISSSGEAKNYWRAFS